LNLLLCFKSNCIYNSCYLGGLRIGGLIDFGGYSTLDFLSAFSIFQVSQPILNISAQKIDLDVVQIGKVGFYITVIPLLRVLSTYLDD